MISAMERSSPSAQTAPNPLDNVSVVLVGTLQAGNIGSAARAMKNMGVRRLKLVSPRQRVNAECRRLAGKAMDLVENAEVFETFEEAIDDAGVVAATTSARDRSHRRPLVTPREAAPTLLAHARHQKIALVFGPERSGLSEEQIAKSQILVSIPASPEYPVLNLAQSVLLVVYELGLLQNALPASRAKVAPQPQRQEMFDQIQRVLIRIGFLSSGNPETMMNSIRKLLDQPSLTLRDVRIVRGIMSQIDWFVREGWKLDVDRIRKP